MEKVNSEPEILEKLRLTKFHIQRSGDRSVLSDSLCLEP